MVDNARKNRAYGIRNALQKLATLPIVAQRDPNTNDKRYPIGQLWINQVTNSTYILTSVVANVPNWEPTGTVGSAPISEYIVAGDGSADYTTIQAALDAANTAGVPATVILRPGTYTENLTLYDEIDIEGNIYTGVTITGVHTPPTSGRITIQDCSLTSATDIFNSAVAGTTSITIEDCVIDVTNGYLFNLLNWTGFLGVFDTGAAGTTDGFVNNTGGAAITAVSSEVGAGAGTYTISGGTIRLRDMEIRCAGTFGGAASIDIDGSVFLGTITTAGTATILMANSVIETGATAAISHGSANPLTLSGIVINSSNNPAIAGAGAGVITLGSITFENNDIIAVGLIRSSVPKLAIGGLKIGQVVGVSTIGGATLVAGTVVVATTAVLATSRIFVTRSNIAGVPGYLSVTAVAPGISFTVTSSNVGDTSNFDWFIINPA